jgi:hypothetical protein
VTPLATSTAVPSAMIVAPTISNVASHALACLLRWIGVRVMTAKPISGRSGISQAFCKNHPIRCP